MKLLNSLALSAIVIVTACNSEENGTGKLHSDLENLEQIIGKTTEDFKGNLDELLTLEIASKASGFESKIAEKDYLKGGAYESVKYKWKKTKRVRKIEFMKGRFIDAPIDDMIELSWVQNTTLEKFKRDYHTLTKAEIENAEKAMDKKLDEMESDGSVSEDQSKAASSTVKSSIESLKVTEAKNVGDYAVFVDNKLLGVATRSLKVFYRDLSFTINVDLSDDIAYNDKKAIEVARMIIDEKLK